MSRLNEHQSKVLDVIQARLEPNGFYPLAAISDLGLVDNDDEFVEAWNGLSIAEEYGVLEALLDWARMGK